MWHITFLLCFFFNFQISFGVNVIPNSRIKRQASRCTTPNGVAGTCISITGCKELLDLLPKSSSDPGIKQFLLKSKCGYEQTFPKVCCRANISKNPTTVKPVNSFGTPKRDHFPVKCGVSGATNNRIVDGRPAPLRAWPWMALLGRQGREKAIDWMCGGTLITNKHVVTAAHCLERRILLVRLGDLDISTTNDGANHIDVPVNNSIPHESYNRRLLINDIGIVYLRTTVQFTSDVQPICLPLSAQLRSNDFVGFWPFIAGWGLTKSGSREKSAHLLEAQVEVKSTDDCSAAYAKLPDVSTIDENVICAGGETKDSCQGDSGGPLMIPQQDGLYYLVGVVSYGHGCGEIGFPGVYTRITEFIDWISEKTK